MQSAKHKSEPPNDPWSSVHPLAPEDAAAMTALRSAVAGMKGKLEGIPARAPFNSIMQRVEAPEGVTFEQDAIGGIPGWWAKPAQAREGKTILHLHGGWFNWGTAQAFCNLVGHIALRAGAAAFIPDYRLAPEHPFPAAVKMARPATAGWWTGEYAPSR
jgi:epsilon-lactone hydrolase